MTVCVWLYEYTFSPEGVSMWARAAAIFPWLILVPSLCPPAPSPTLASATLPIMGSAKRSAQTPRALFYRACAFRPARSRAMARARTCGFSRDCGAKNLKNAVNFLEQHHCTASYVPLSRTSMWVASSYTFAVSFFLRPLPSKVHLILLPSSPILQTPPPNPPSLPPSLPPSFSLPLLLHLSLPPSLSPSLPPSLPPSSQDDDNWERPCGSQYASISALSGEDGHWQWSVYIGRLVNIYM